MKSIHELNSFEKKNVPKEKRSLQPPRQHIYERVTTELRSQVLRSHRPGDRLDTEPNLAHHFGVSIPTIRNAMLVLEREGLVERRQGSGTYVCDRRASQHVGVAINVEALALPALTAFYLSTARQVWQRFEEAGQRVKLYATTDKESPDHPQIAQEELLDAAEQGRLSALVVFTILPSDVSERLHAAGVILIGFNDLAAVRVNFDYEGMVRDGVRLLVEAGCRRIALVGWGAPRYRRIGSVFAEALTSLGVQPRTAWIRDDLDPALPGAGWEDFREIWSASTEKPDGILFCDDILYRDASISIRELNIRVPDDLMIVTHHNKGNTLPHLFPATLLQFDTDAYAEALTQGTLALLRGETPPEKECILKHQVVSATPMRRAVSTGSAAEGRLALQSTEQVIADYITP